MAKLDERIPRHMDLKGVLLGFSFQLTDLMSFNELDEHGKLISIKLTDDAWASLGLLLFAH